jgi:hypothetical protein
MSYCRLSLGASFCLMLVALCGWPTESAAQTDWPSTYIYGDNATLTVAVLPLRAEVWLDGVFLGSARDLIAAALPILPGEHVVQVSAPGYLPSVVNVPGTPNWASHVHLELVPDRRP